MVAAAPFGDVMQQHGNVQYLSRQHIVDDLAANRQLILQFATLNLAQHADCTDRVLVGCVNMVHVVLHLRYDPAKIRYETAENAGFVHTSERAFRPLL